jgi:hypothetical protein
VDRAEYEAWKKAQGAQRRREKEKAAASEYDPRTMKVGMPGGCRFMILAAVVLLIYLLSRLLFH